MPPHHNKQRQKHAIKAKRIKAVSQVRIIGGQYKRRLLNFIDSDGLRPTPDRVRETVFNWLVHDLQHARVLDTCAGSGALGFEALSRGAATVTLIEASAQQATLLAQSATTLGINNETLSIHHGRAECIIPELSDVFDLVFIDPPYDAELWQPIVQSLLTHQRIHQGSLLYLEGDCSLAEMLTGLLADMNFFETVKFQRFGQIYAYVLRIITPILPPPAAQFSLQDL